MTIVLALVLVAASAIDLRWQRLPDWLTLPLVAIGVVLTWTREDSALPRHKERSCE